MKLRIRPLSRQVVEDLWRRASSNKSVIGPAFKSMSATAVTLIASFSSGVLLARVLGDDGRGAVTSIQTLVSFLAAFCSLGVHSAVVHLVAKRTFEPGQVLNTLLVPALALGFVMFGAAMLMAPLILADQGAHSVRSARVFSLLLVCAPVTDVCVGILAGDHRFGRVAVIRAATPILLAFGLAALFAIDHLSVDNALAVSFASSLFAFPLSLLQVKRLYPSMGRLDRGVRRVFAFGIRSHVSNLSGLVTARLDLFLLPLVMSKAEIGHYAVATNLIATTSQLPAAAAAVALPLISRSEDAEGVLRKLLALTAGLSLATLVPLALGAEWIIPKVFGTAFSASVTPFRIMAPGAIAAAIGYLLSMTLQGRGRPLLSSLGLLAGMVVTVVGLGIVLPAHSGIIPVAWVSLFTYLTVGAVTTAVFLLAERQRKSQALQAGKPTERFAGPSTNARRA